MPEDKNEIYNRLYNAVYASIRPILQKRGTVMVMGDVVEPLLRAVAAELADIRDEMRGHGEYEI